MVARFILTPYFLDQPLPGLEPLLDPNWVINQPSLPDQRPQVRMAALYKSLAALVASAVSSGEIPVSVAGDCCTSLGILAGLQQAGINPTLIWFDAHGDFNTWETSPSGFLGGMPLAMLVGRGEQTIMEHVSARPLSEERVILSDARDLDPDEGKALAHSQVNHLPNVHNLLSYPLPEGPIWIHFDTDVIDAGEAPAMNYPVSAGPSAADLQAVLRFLAATGQIAAVSLSSWNPELDQDGRSRKVSMGLLMDLISQLP